MLILTFYYSMSTTKRFKFHQAEKLTVGTVSSQMYYIVTN